MVYFVLSGTVESDDGERRRHDGPAALLLDEDTFEGLEGRGRTTFCNHGEPLEVIELRVSRADVAIPRREPIQRLELPDAAWAAARAMAKQPADDESMARTAGALHRALVECGVLGDAGDGERDGERRGRHATELWSAVRPLAEKLELLSSLDTVAMLSGLSVRHLARELEAFTTTFKVPFSSWRETTRRLRLKVVTMALSSEELAIFEVASLMGYGSVEAMARAFRDAGAPAPSRVRDELRAARARLRG
jgi:AraC-like DNA-binding protein